jgi:hypothetical protein
MNDRGAGLIAWTFATFHASAFVLVILFLAYRGGGLGQALQGLNTAVGLGLFVALWATTYVATRRAFDGLGVERPAPIDQSALIARGMTWGAFNGVMFLGVLVVGIAGGAVVTHPGDVMSALTSPAILPGVLVATVYVVVASLVAGAVGAAVGIVFAAIDLILLGIAARLHPRATA